jgi:hypothetical protein
MPIKVWSSLLRISLPVTDASECLTQHCLGTIYSAGIHQSAFEDQMMLTI